ncbi:hypothetical protein LUZ61_000353 [Rhynchospora tenuis]|uniref:Reverse transcriptase zinc-binding domain-containing protein n=1 Tax=Rhynchospora tenuis TaxID=198213 RepID=A0AAD5ZEZ9_9POAL|nr:hypothetical protein LUZ61_000353 [Rhynchospora tenuis]
MPSLPSSDLSTSQLQQLLLLLSNNPNLFLNLHSHLPDIPHWKLHPPSFSTNSFYKFFKTTPAPLSDLRLIWKLKAPPRMVVFAWQLLQHRIPTQNVLQKRGWHLANRCSLCYAASETPQHISQDCPFFISSIQRVYQLAAIHQPCSATTESLLLSPVPEKRQRELLLITCFTVWRERCNRIFSSTHKPPSAIAEESFFEWGCLNAPPA